MSSLLNSNWTGSLYLRRVNDRVEILGQNLVPASAAGSALVLTFPTGFAAGVPQSVRIPAIPLGGKHFTIGGTLLHVRREDILQILVCELVDEAHAGRIRKDGRGCIVIKAHWNLVATKSICGSRAPRPLQPM